MDKSRKEREFEAGQLADLQAEKEEFQKEYTIDDKIAGIDRIVGTIVLANEETGMVSEVLVCSDKHSTAAWWVAKKYGLELCVAPFFPENEVFVALRTDIDVLIRSRVDKNSAERRIIIPSAGIPEDMLSYLQRRK